VTLNCGISEEACIEKEVNLNCRRTFGCISYFHVELDCRSKLDPKSKRYICIEYGTSKYDYQFWDPENRKILRHKDVIFNERKVYKGLLMERSTPEKDIGVAPQSTLEQQSSAADSEFVELDDISVEKS